MIAVAGIAGVALLLYLLYSSQAHAEESLESSPGADAATKAVAAANLTADPEKLEEHAAQAAGAGYPQTAAAIRERAAALRSSTVKALPAAEGETALRSPLAEASQAAWTKYVALMAHGNFNDTVSPAGNLGLFQMSLPRLADLHYVTNLHKDESGKWAADWVPPLSREKFLDDLKVQYEAFIKSTLADRRFILAHHKSAIGRVYARKVASLSGLLAVARQAGGRGLAAWLASGASKVKYPNTTAAFLRANGTF